MSYSEGQFNETILLEQRARADQMMMDPLIRQQWQPKTNFYNYIRSLQNAKLNEAFNARGRKDFDVEIMWMNTCDDFEIADESCALGGKEASTNTQIYTLRRRKTYGFNVADDVFRDNAFDAEEALAKLLLRVDKQASEDFTKYLVDFVNINAGRNAVTDRYTVEDDRTDIPADQWTAELMAYFARVMEMNRFNNAAMVSGANLWETMMVAAANNANVNDKGDYILWNSMPIWFDLFNVDTVNNDNQHIVDGLFTYLITQGAIAVANKTWNPPAPQRTFDDVRYTMPSQFMPGMTYDVYYTNKCQEDSAADFDADTDADSTGYRGELADNRGWRDGNFRSDALMHKYKIVLTAEAFVNPYGCDEDNLGHSDSDKSGILRFRNV